MPSAEISAMLIMVSQVGARALLESWLHEITDGLVELRLWLAMGNPEPLAKFMRRSARHSAGAPRGRHSAAARRDGAAARAMAAQDPSRREGEGND